jgi:AmmeMemoRadiSam system protein B
MLDRRKPAVAGTFYPADPIALASLVDDLLAGAPPAGPLPWALVVPHAALVYSGKVAARAYRTLDVSVRRVVLVGPAHYVALEGMAVPRSDGFVTPLGEVPVDTGLRDRALGVDGVKADDDPHRPEHSLEVQLPFLQRILPECSVLPVVVGDATDVAVERLLECLGDIPDTLVVVSTDLSHHLADPVARVRDASTAAAIVAREPDRVRPGDACGQVPVRGLLRCARARGFRVECLGLATSADAGSPPDAVVGYGAFVVRPGERPSPTD